MDEGESREDINNRIRKGLTDIFGSFEEFSERVARNRQTSKHGIIRSKMRPSRSSPFVTLHAPPSDSPSHISVQVALQSMKNLVEDPPISALPIELPSLRKNSDSSTKKRKTEDPINEIDVKRKKETSKNSARSFTPDSGVHSTGSDLQDEPNSEEVATMLSIMKTINEPKLSPIPERILREFEKEKSLENDEKPSTSKEKPVEKVEKKEKIEKAEEKKQEIVKKPEKIKKTTKYLSDSSTSSASTSREATPEVEERPPPPPPPAPPVQKNSPGMLKLKYLKSEKLQKLVDLAKKNGKLQEGEKSEKLVEKKEKIGKSTSSARNSPLPPPSQPPKHLPNKTVQNLQVSEIATQNSLRNLSPSSTTSTAQISGPSPRSIRSTTPTVFSRPSSVLSVHDPTSSNPEVSVQVPTIVTSSATPSTSTAPTTTTVKSTRWICQWDHAKLKTMNRVPIPDPTTCTKSKGDFYREMAKEWKKEADTCNNRVLRALNYMNSCIFFILEAIWRSDRERSVQGKVNCSNIYRDSHELLGCAVFQAIQPSDDTLVVHLLPRVKILGQIMLAVMQYQMYILRSEPALKNLSRLDLKEVTDTIEVRPISIASNSSIGSSNSLAPPRNRPPGSSAPQASTPSAGSTPSGGNSSIISPWMQSVATCQTTVTMPQVIFETYKTQIKSAGCLMKASQYWEDMKMLSRVSDPTFIKDIETICGKSIGMDMSFDTLAPFVLTAVGSLRAEYEEERKLPVKPVMQKVKKSLDHAIRTGIFHPDRPLPNYSRLPQSSTPQNPHQEPKAKLKT